MRKELAAEEKNVQYTIRALLLWMRWFSWALRRHMAEGLTVLTL